MAQGENIVPIPGTKRVEFLEQNIAALDLTLTSDDLAQLDAAIPVGAAEGTRYAAPQMAALNR